jgi:Na+-driven multidrug efflux pump
VGLVVIQAFNGAGDTRTPTWLNALCFWALQLPLAYGLAEWLRFGPHGVFYAAFISESMLAVGAWILFRRGGWKQQSV